MRRIFALALAGLLATGCGLGPSASLAGDRAGLRQGTGAAGGRYLVKFRDGVARSSQDARLKQIGAVTLREIGPLGVRVVRVREPGALRGPDVEYLEADTVRQIPEAAARRQARPAARGGAGANALARPGSPANGNRATGSGQAAVYPESATSRYAAYATAGRTVNDPFVGDQWGLGAIRAGQAWERTMGSPDVIVAVVDTGVDLTHPDLRDRMVAGISFVNEVSGASGEPGDDKVTPARNTGPMDDNGHGTHVAGIIAAQANNGEGIAGVAPNCRLMPVKVLAYNTRGFDGDVAAGIVWAVDHGARVVNMSLGGEGGGKTLEAAIRYAHARGALVVAAMGNDGLDPTRNHGTNLNYPAAYEGVLAVSAIAADGTAAAFSNRGRWNGVAAPGTRILSTTPTYDVYDPVMPRYDRLDGTSMATPFVSGLAALVLSAQPHLSGREAKRVMEATAQDLLFPGFDLSTGHGLIDAAAAVTR